MLKGYKKLDSYLTDWCHKNGFDVTCKLSTDFMYNPKNKTLYYAMVIPERHATKFKQVTSSMLNEENDIFVLSFFHELGHYKTLDYLEKSDMAEYWKVKAGKDADNYYHHKVEYVATEWACDYINRHQHEVDEFFNRFLDLLYIFYSNNNITND